MSDFTKDLNAAVDRNQAIIDDYKGRELRLGDRVVSTDENAPSTKTIVDAVEDALDEKSLELTTQDRREVEDHARALDRTSNQVLRVSGNRKEGPGSTYGSKRAGEYEMECRARIRHEEKTGDNIAVQQSWGDSDGMMSNEASTSSQTTTRGGSAGVEVGPVSIGVNGSDTKGESTTAGTGANRTSSSGAQAITNGERRNGEVFLRCEVETSYQDEFDGFVIDSGSEHHTFDVEVGKHSIVRQEG